jgi:hypothetical protein
LVSRPAVTNLVSALSDAVRPSSPGEFMFSTAANGFPRRHATQESI